MKKNPIKNSVTSHDFSFAKRERLCGVHAVKSVFKYGKVYTWHDVRLIVYENGLDYNRFMCTFRRGFGSAVQRNRARRLSKEVYRGIKSYLRTGYDMVLLVRSPQDAFEQREVQLSALFKKAQLYHGFIRL